MELCGTYFEWLPQELIKIIFKGLYRCDFCGRFSKSGRMLILNKFKTFECFDCVGVPIGTHPWKYK